MRLEDPKPLVQIDRGENEKYSIQLVPNLSRDILATGPLYTGDLLKIAAADMHGIHTSGVMGKSNPTSHLKRIIFQLITLVLV